MQLDTKGLLAVNGGTSCSSSSSSSTGGSSSTSTGGGSGTGGSGSSVTTAHGGPEGRPAYGSDGTPISYEGSYSPPAANEKTTKEEAKPTKYGRIRNRWWGPIEWSDGSYINENGERVYPPKVSGGKGESVSSGGGSCSSSSEATNGPSSSVTSPDPSGGETNKTADGDTKPQSGKFGQITDGSYADKLTMQYYVNHKEKYGNFTGLLDASMNGENNRFSTDGCKMAAAAKVASEVTGIDVDLSEINYVWDSDKNGFLTKEEICYGLNNLLDKELGDVYDVKTKAIDDPTLKNLQDIVDDSSGTTYVLGKAADVHGGQHWVVLEGYTANSDGTITFTYDGSSDNDAAKSRTYVIGKSNTAKNIHNIVQIQTFKVYKK